MRDIALSLALKFHETTRADEAAVLATAASFNAFLSDGETPTAEQPEPAKPATRRKAADKSTNDSETSNKQTLEPVTPATADAGSVTTASDASSITTTGTTAATTAAPLEITRDAMLAEATSYSQKHDLAVVLAKLGAERFSAVPAERYGEFMALLTEGASTGNALD